MAAVSTVLLGASLAATAAGTAMSSKAQRKQAQADLNAAYYNAEMADMQAEDIRRKSQEEADKILTQAARVRSTQQAQVAANGMVVGEGSAQTMVDETTKLSTADALVALYDGIDGYVYTTSMADNTRTAGQNNAAAGIAGANATVVSGIGSMAGSMYNHKLTTKK